uniref:hypothetical protein n=1 Tax=Aetokthonos hydrillicola TaxID=1550245 RepID=UPI001ABB937D
RSSTQPTLNLNFRLNRAVLDEYVARKMRNLCFDIGLKNIVTLPYPIQMFSPLSSHQKNYIAEESQWFIKTAHPYLSQTEAIT